MVKRSVTFLGMSLLILSWSVMPILGLQSSSRNILSEGTVIYPENELGVWGEWKLTAMPDEASWHVVDGPIYEKWRDDISVILNWHSLHPPWNPFNPFETESEIKHVENGLKSIPTENFWGIPFAVQEHDRTFVEFNDDVNTTWFGENLLGYPLYLKESPSATVDDWKDEMFLRMIRGFYDYFHPLTKVGITVGAYQVVVNFRNKPWAKGVSNTFGEKALTFIREYYDFVILYIYTHNLEDFHWTKQYFSAIDELFPKQKKFWILTRIFSHNEETWEPEAIALEMKNCLDRNIIIMPYSWSEPPLEENWALMLKAIELYDAKAPYTESLVHDTNLLTGVTNETYGWVANPEHDEGL